MSLGMDLNFWRAGMQRALKGHPHSLAITKTLSVVLRFIDRTGWQGACHAASAVVYLLLCEQSVKAELCLGEAQHENIVFNHSWIEIDGEVYDVAIVQTLDGASRSAPVVKGINVETGQPADILYGVHSGQPDDPYAAMLRKTSFVDFLDGFPDHPSGLWGLAADLGGPLGLRLDSAGLRERHADSRWVSR